MAITNVPTVTGVNAVFSARPNVTNVAKITGVGSLEGPNLITATSVPSAAYSFKKLGSYAGPLVRVRRLSDNAELDISASGSQLDSAALTSFLTSTSGVVTTWYDQSGNGYNLVQATTGSQPEIAQDAAGVWHINTVDGKFLRTATFVGALTNSTFHILWSAVSNGASPVATAFQGGVDFSTSNADLVSPWWTTTQGPTRGGSTASSFDWIDRRPRQHIFKWLNGTETSFEFASFGRNTYSVANPAFTRFTVGKNEIQNANMKVYEAVLWPANVNEQTIFSVTKEKYAALFPSIALRINLGDSNTCAGFVGTDLQWTRKVYASKGYSTMHISRALGGNTIQNFLTNIGDITFFLTNFNYTSAQVIIFLGTNDIAVDTQTGAQTLTKLKTLAQNLKAAGATSIVVVTMLPRTAGGSFSSERDAFNTALMADVSGDFNIKVDTRTNANLQNQNNATYFVDTTHLSAAGQTELANLIAAAI